MKKFGILILSFLSIAIFQSCEKKSLLDNENEMTNDEIVLNGIDGLQVDRYFLNGELIAKSDINFENDQLILLHGVLENKNDVLVFESRTDFYNWADTKSDTNIDQLVQGIKDADAARQYAIESGEDLNGEPSDAFLKYLEDNYSDDSKIGLGKLYEGYDLSGAWSYLLGSIPIARFKYPNQASCIELFGRWYTLYDNTWWKGYMSIYGGIGSYFNFTFGLDDNRMESVWTI